MREYYSSDKEYIVNEIVMPVIGIIALLALAVGAIILEFAFIAGVALIISKLFGISFWITCIVVAIIIVGVGRSSD